jgi:hypothetical protein
MGRRKSQSTCCRHDTEFYPVILNLGLVPEREHSDPLRA